MKILDPSAAENEQRIEKREHKEEEAQSRLLDRDKDARAAIRTLLLYGAVAALTVGVFFALMGGSAAVWEHHVRTSKVLGYLQLAVPFVTGSCGVVINAFALRSSIRSRRWYLIALSCAAGCLSIYFLGIVVIWGILLASGPL